MEFEQDDMGTPWEVPQEPIKDLGEKMPLNGTPEGDATPANRE
jgi:hypothetical protein